MPEELEIKCPCTQKNLKAFQVCLYCGGSGWVKPSNLKAIRDRFSNIPSLSPSGSAEYTGHQYHYTEVNSDETQQIREESINIGKQLKTSRSLILNNGNKITESRANYSPLKSKRPRQ